MKIRHALAILAALYLLVYIAPLGVRPLTTPDETRYAEIPREMIESGDWIVPRLNGLRYFEKPPLGYWVTAASIMVFGQNEFAVRLPSAVSVGLTVFLVFLLASRSKGGSWAGLLASVVFLTSLEVFAVGITNILDSLLAFFLTGALASFYWAHIESRPGKRKGFLVLFGLFCGLAFLTKGFLALAIPVLIIGPFLLLEKRWRDLLTAPWIPIAVAVAVALPWGILIHLKESDFWTYFFWVEHMNRFLKPEGPAHHAEPAWFFLPLLIGSMVLWIPLVPAVISGFRRKNHEAGPLILYAAIWFLAPFLFFSASSGKLGTYILPCFPPLAILLGIGLDRYLATSNRRLFAIGAATSAALALVAAGYLVSHEAAANASTQWFGEGESWKWMTGSLAFAVWSIFCLLAAIWAQKNRGVWLFGAAPLFLLLTINVVLPDKTLNKRAPGAFIRAQAEHVEPGTHVYSDEFLLPAVCWYLERSDLNLVGKKGELRYGLGFEDSRHRWLSMEDLGRFLESQRRPNDVGVFFRKFHFEELLRVQPIQGSIPDPSFQSENQDQAFAVFSK